jgi:ribosomal protein S18 acetylase RimI-like enzyme
VHVVSLGFRTDLMLRRLAGATMSDCGDHLVVETPSNPAFYWGNFLLLAEPPAPETAAHWLDVFTETFPSARHVAIGIDGVDGETGDITELLGAGLELETNVVLTAQRLVSADRPGGTEVRPLRTDADWQQSVALRLVVDEDDSPAHVEFVERKEAEARQLAQRGHGEYVGAFVDGVLRASLGIVTDGSGLARYQNVHTHPGHRRRGHARALLHAAAEIARDRFGATTLVIAADPDYVAIDLYRQLGFVDTERQVQLQRAPG